MDWSAILFSVVVVGSCVVLCVVSYYMGLSQRPFRPQPQPKPTQLLDDGIEVVAVAKIPKERLYIAKSYKERK